MRPAAADLEARSPYMQGIADFARFLESAR